MNVAGSDIADEYKSLKWFTKRGAADIPEDLMYNYYTYELYGKTFYKYIARKQID